MSTLFGQPANSSPFSFGTGAGATNSQPASTSLFGNALPNTSTTMNSNSSNQGANVLNNQNESNKRSLFGPSLSTNTPAQTNQPSNSLFGQPQNQQQQPSLFGNSQQGQQNAASGPTNTGIFGSSQSQQTGNQQNSGLFGSFGAPSQQQPQQQGQQQQQLNQNAQSTQQNLFGSLNSRPGQSLPLTQQPVSGTSMLSQTQSQSRIFQGSEIAPRHKSVVDQIELAFAKWNPQSPHTLFQTYLYNSVAPENAPFYGPGPNDDESKWEEALARKPSVGSIPVIVRGFEELAHRMQQQFVNLGILRGRLHEINDGLTAIMQKHEVDLSVRAKECRRKHITLSRQCLNLATKTQMLKNRGYVMDAAEEELRKKLLQLERHVLDPALTGRGEQIWARMITVRERGRQLQRDYEKAGKSLQGSAGTVVIDESVQRQAQKILDDYHLQLSHLAKELEQIRQDWSDWEASSSSAGHGSTGTVPR